MTNRVMSRARINDIDDYDVIPIAPIGFSDPFGKGWERDQPITLKEYTPDGLLGHEVRTRTLRTRHFAEQLVRIYAIVGAPVPYAFEDRNGLIRKLDAGCLGFLYNRAKPEIACELNREGYIFAVEPLPHLIDRVSRPEFDEVPDWDEPEPLGFEPGDVTPPAEQKMAEVRIREAAPEFRRNVFLQWSSRCALTGEPTSVAIEAAHLHPYVNATTNDVRNGIALRADLHRLLDAGLLSFATEKGALVARVSKKLEGTDYAALHGTPLEPPRDQRYSPDPRILEWLNARFDEAEQED